VAVQVFATAGQVAIDGCSQLGSDAAAVEPGALSNAWTVSGAIRKVTLPSAIFCRQGNSLARLSAESARVQGFF